MADGFEVGIGLRAGPHAIQKILSMRYVVVVAAALFFDQLSFGVERPPTRVADDDGTVVAAGHKVGFCLLDDHAWSPTAGPQAKYDCWNQGIQSGWADVYAAGLPCQYIDVTGVPGGNYTLRMTVNPDGLIPEANTNNNVALVPVTIPKADQICLLGPFNDSFFNGKVIKEWTTEDIVLV